MCAMMTWQRRGGRGCAHGTRRVGPVLAACCNSTPPSTPRPPTPAAPTGALYWQGWVEGTTAAEYTLNPAGRYGILPTDPAFPIIADFSTGARALEEPAITCPADRPLLAPIFPTQLSCPAGCARGWWLVGEVDSAARDG